MFELDFIAYHRDIGGVPGLPAAMNVSPTQESAFTLNQGDDPDVNLIQFGNFYKFLSSSVTVPTRV